jgi:hypothetical protein
VLDGTYSTGQSVDWNFDTYITSKQQLLDEGFVFSRASTGLCVNANGFLQTKAANEPRFHHALVVNSNYLPHSNTLSLAPGTPLSWQFNGTQPEYDNIFAPYEEEGSPVAPDGGTSVTLVGNTGGITIASGAPIISLSGIPSVQVNQWVFSFWAKNITPGPINLSRIFLELWLDDIEVLPQVGTGEVLFNIPRSSSWTRYAFVINSTTPRPQIAFRGVEENTTNPHFLFIWGFQLTPIGNVTDNITTEAFTPVTQTTSVPMGLLLEGTTTNLLYQTNNLGVSQSPGWNTRNQLNTSGSWTGMPSPDLQTTAVNLVPNTTSNEHYLGSSNVSLTSGTTYTCSVYAQANGYNFFGLRITTGPSVWVSLEGLVAQSAEATDKLHVIPLADGWVRVVVTWTQATTTTTAQVRLHALNANQNPNGYSFAGNNSNGVIVWGPQLEESSGATSYVASGSSQGVRSRDILSHSNLGALIGTQTTERTVVVDYQQTAHTTSPTPIVSMQNSNGESETFSSTYVTPESAPPALVTTFSGTYTDSGKSWTSYYGSIDPREILPYSPFSYVESVGYSATNGIVRVGRAGTSTSSIVDASKVPTFVAFTDLYVGPSSYDVTYKGAIVVRNLFLQSRFWSLTELANRTKPPSTLLES